MWYRIRQFWTPLRFVEAASVLAVIAITLWELHPNLVFSSTLLTGGDTGSHVALPAYLRTQGNLFNLTPWYPGWFAGMPAYTYYFVLPDFFATLASYVIGLAVAFKLATVVGSLLLPVTAYCMAKLFRAPRPVPAALAIATLPFLFDASYTIDGGNLFSSMAGEYSFSLSLALSLLTIGLFARGVRTGRGYWFAALALSATLASHILPWLFTIGAVGVLVLFELLQRRGIGDPKDELGAGDYARPVRFAFGAGLLSIALSAWWLLTFLTTQNLTNSMGYTNVNVKTLRAIFTTLGWFNSTGGVAGDWWVIVLAFVAVVVAFMVRDRLGMVLTTLVMASLGSFVFDPQSVIWNERLVPFWYITIHLSVGWLVGYTLSRWIERAKQRRRGLLVYIEGGKIAFQRDDEDLVLDQNFEEEINDLDQESGTDDTTSAVSPAQPEHDTDETGRHVARRTMRATVAVIVLGLATTVPGLMPKVASVLGLNTSGNQVSSWAQWNYSGYQAKPAWPEYNDLMNTMKTVASQYGCGRAMWEYNSDQNRFGTPMALMLLPYWTNNCVGSMEGLFFESSATTPYHFLNQAELSAAPSNPQVGLNYGQLDVALGVQHLQMLGVKYYIAFSPSVVTQANADKQLQYITSTKAWPSPGATWRIYLIKHSDMVVPMTALPNVVSGISSRVGWLNANQTWWLTPKLWGTVASTSGPASWPRATSITSMDSSMYLPADQVSRVKVGTQSISFHVSSVGVPVLVKISYFPRWKASGASGPYRVSPNLMALVPTSHDVTMTYGSSPALTIGNIISDLATLAAFVTLWFALRRRGFLRR
jgi:hypothetical protein